MLLIALYKYVLYPILQSPSQCKHFCSSPTCTVNTSSLPTVTFDLHLNSKIPLLLHVRSEGVWQCRVTEVSYCSTTSQQPRLRRSHLVKVDDSSLLTSPSCHPFFPAHALWLSPLISLPQGGPWIPFSLSLLYGHNKLWPEHFAGISCPSQ